MKINAINLNNYYQQKNIQKEKVNFVNNLEISKELTLNSYPINYYVASFGAKEKINEHSLFYTDFGKKPVRTQEFDLSETELKNAVANRVLQISYIDTLSKREDIIPDIVEFMSKNKKYSNFINSQTDVFQKSIDEIRTFLEDFLSVYPQYLETYYAELTRCQQELIGGIRFNLSNSLLDKVKVIENNASNFVRKIELCKKVQTDFPNAIEMVNKISAFANPMVLKTDSANKDFSKLLIKNINYNEMAVLNGSNQTQEYNELFPEGIKNKMRNIIKQPAYLKLSNSMTLAVIKEAISQNFITETEIINLFSSNKSIDKELKNLLALNSDFSQKNLNKINEEYNKNKLRLSLSERTDIKRALLEYYNDLSDEDILNMEILISSQGKYLKNILKNDISSKFTLMKFWHDYDSIYGTNHLNNINLGIKYLNAINECNNLIDELDDLNFDKL